MAGWWWWREDNRNVVVVVVVNEVTIEMWWWWRKDSSNRLALVVATVSFLVHLFYLPICKKMTVKTAIVVNMWKHFATIEDKL